jgi:hypothetical protein
MRLGTAARGLHLLGYAGRDLPSLDKRRIALAGVVAPSVVAALLRVTRASFVGLTRQAVTWALNSTTLVSEVPVRRWSANTVGVWLRDLHLEEAATTFTMHRVDGARLLEVFIQNHT